MSIRMSSLVWQYFVAKPERKLLALKLADNADENGCRIFPAVETMAAHCNCSVRSVQRWLSELVDGGFIQLVKYANGGRGKAREYRINPDFIQAHDPQVPQDQRPKWEFKLARPIKSDGDDDGVCPSQKGDCESPFTKPKRVTAQTQKGDSAQSQKGDSAVSPQLPLTVIEPNTPLPPDGGETVKPVDLRSLLASLVQIHGRNNAEDHKPAMRALKALCDQGLSPDDAQRMQADLRSQVASEGWQRDGGRWKKNLSRWIAGWAIGRDAGVGVGVAVQQSVSDQAVQATKALLSSMGKAAVPPPPEVRERMKKIISDAKAICKPMAHPKKGSGNGSN